MIPAEPPRDAILRDADGDIWSAAEDGDHWETYGPLGYFVGDWESVVTANGPVDVFVWRGTKRVEVSE